MCSVTVVAAHSWVVKDILKGILQQRSWDVADEFEKSLSLLFSVGEQPALSGIRDLHIQSWLLLCAIIFGKGSFSFPFFPFGHLFAPSFVPVCRIHTDPYRSHSIYLSDKLVLDLLRVLALSERTTGPSILKSLLAAGRNGSLATRIQPEVLCSNWPPVHSYGTL